MHGAVAQSTFGSKRFKNTACSDHSWTLKRCFVWQVQGIVHLVKSERNVRFLQAKALAGVGHLKRICKHAFSKAGIVQKICSSEMLGGHSADFLNAVAFWSVR